MGDSSFASHSSLIEIDKDWVLAVVETDPWNSASCSVHARQKKEADRAFVDRVGEARRTELACTGYASLLVRGFVVRAMPVGAETFVTAINWGVLSAEEADRIQAACLPLPFHLNPEGHNWAMVMFQS